MRAIHMEGSTSLCSDLENERHAFFVEKFGFQDSGSSEKPTFFIIFHPLSAAARCVSLLIRGEEWKSIGIPLPWLN